jgi:O-antigen ligase
LANDSFRYLYGKPNDMQPLRSLLFYVPILLIFIVDPSSQDIGLWARFSAASAASLVGIYLYRNEMKGGFTILSLMAMALVLSIVKVGQVAAASELYAFVARIAFLSGWILVAKAAFTKNKEGALKALGMGSQIALAIAALSILPSLAEAYQENNIYLANGPLFTHKNYAAATLLLLLPLAFLGRFEGGAGKWIQILSIATAGLAILLLRTRGVWLGGIAMALVATINYVIQGNTKRRNQGLIALGVLAVGIGIAIAAGGSEKIFNSDTIQSRLHYWNASWEMFMDKPISGVGGGQWKIEYPAQGLKGTNESVMNGVTNILRPHNDFLWMLSETGIFGAILFVGILVIGFWQNFKKEGNIYMALVVVGFAVYGFGEFPLERASMLWPLAIALGYASTGLKTRLESPTNAMVAGVMITFALVVSSSRMMSEREAKQSLDGYMTRNAPLMQTNAESAQSIFFEMDIYNNPMAYFEGLGILSASGNQPTQRDVNKAQEAFEYALEIHPNHMLTLNQLASIHRMKGELNEAAALYDQVLEMSPRNTTAALKQVEVMRSLGDIYGSLDALKMISSKYNPTNLNGLGPEATKTLRAFAKQAEVRPSMRSLHQNLQGVPPSKMWEVWVKWRNR